MAVPRIPSGESLLALLDVVYDTQGNDVDWLAEVAGAVAPATGATCGVHAYFVDASTEALRLLHPMLVGGPRSWQRHWRSDWWDPFMAAMDQSTLRSVHGFGPCSFATDIWEAAQLQIPVLSEYLSAMASSRWGATHQRYLKPNRAPAGSSPIFPDSFNLFASDGEGSGCAVIVNLPEVRAARFTPAEAAFWGKLSSHVAAGLRLRRQRHRQRKGSTFDDAEGIFSAAGQALHASGQAKPAAARSALRQAALLLDKARSRRVEGSEKLELWKALVAGRWSIKEEFDDDGRRFIVARPNAPTPPGRPHLTHRERQVAELVASGHSNKLIAYELGVTPSTVSTHVAGLARKLRAKTRIELILAVRTGSLT